MSLIIIPQVCYRLRVITVYELLLLWLDAARINQQTSGEPTTDTATVARTIESPEIQLPAKCPQSFNEMEKFAMLSNIVTGSCS